MAQARVTAATAFDLPRQRSQHTNTQHTNTQHTNIKLRDVAGTVIAEISGRPTDHGTDVP